ncbi:hypothetical protein HTZ84_22540 [Haloterrigena sp. SYSU A558-1]|uniref:Uncharacterized protein n=1 Tax=Haloterrigena gelatinilytica TaxID=2741724 RepID=A0ABX2LN06_9EURY|nr:hypothetical protein [Haloterrigena gelatinilytica]NUC75047.1 hypothetical protein [Haloterrigena gelatinilytica]
MIGNVLLETTNISTGDVSHWQETISWVVLVLVLSAYIGLRLYMRYSWLDDDQRRHLREIRPAIAGTTWHRVTITDDEDRADRFRTVAKAMGAKGGLEAETGGVRAAMADVREWVQSRLPSVPPLAIRATVEGLAVLALGLLASLPLAWWERAFGVSDSGLSAGSAINAVGSLLDLGVWFLETTVPAGGTVVALALSVVVLVGQAMTTLWLPLGLVLIGGAVALAWLNHITEEDLSATLYPDRRALCKRVGQWMFGIWAASAVVGLVSARAGLVVMAVGATLAAGWGVRSVLGRIFDAANMDPLGRDGHDVEPLSADNLLSLEQSVDDATKANIDEAFAGALEYDPYDAALMLESKLDATDQEWRGEPAQPAVAAYLVARKLLGAAFVVTIPILMWLAGRAVLTGALARPFAALSAAPWWGRLAIVGAPIAVVAYLSTYAEGRAAEHLRAFRHWVAVRVIQSAGFARGIPIAAVALGFLVGWAYVSLTAALITAAVAGIGVRSAQLLYERGRVRAGRAFVRSAPYLVGGAVFAIVLSRTDATLGAAVFGVVTAGVALAARRAWRRYGLGLGEPERQRRPPTDIVVEIPDAPVFDANGEAIYIARVDGRPLATSEPKRLFRDIQRIVNHRFETGETPELLAHAYYKRLVDSGIVDEETALKSVRGDLATRVTATLEKKGGVECEALEDELQDEYPQELIDPTLEWLEQRQDIGVRDGQYVPVS